MRASEVTDPVRVAELRRSPMMRGWALAATIAAAVAIALLLVGLVLS